MKAINLFSLFLVGIIATSCMEGNMRSGKYKQGFDIGFFVNEKVFEFRTWIPIWIKHKYNKYQFKKLWQITLINKNK